MASKIILIPLLSVIVAINDGSTDGTENIILDYRQRGIPITYYKQKNEGFASARNKAIELARGEWIAIIDHDDLCLPDRLAIQATHIKENSNCNLFFGNTIHFRNGDVEVRRHYDQFNPQPVALNLTAGNATKNLIKYGCFIDTESVIFNKEAAQFIGGFDTHFNYVADFDFFLRMGERYDLYAGNEILAKWRVHPGQLTQKIGPVHQEELNQIYRKYLKSNKIHILTRTCIGGKLFYFNLKQHIKRLG